MDYLVETEVACPACGEEFTIVVDTSEPGGELVCDCEVCCRPMELRIRARPGAVLDVSVGRA